MYQASPAGTGASTMVQPVPAMRSRTPRAAEENDDGAGRGSPGLLRSMPGLAGVSGGVVALDELVGDRVEVLADVVRLRADVERGVALAQDQRGLPAGRACA